MDFLLALDTTTRNCSVAIFANSDLISIEEKLSDKHSHSEQLNLFISKAIASANISLQQIKAVVLSNGPGSYTGLRIGAATAKGLCYSLGIPLISISTLKSMAFGIDKKTYKYYCPMIDARRQEVFAAVYDKNNNEVRGVRADIVDANTYKRFLSEKVLFFGDGASKCQEIIKNNNAYFKTDIFPSAKNMAYLGFSKFKNKIFEDIAYFEPNYLKDFVLGKK